MATTYAVSLNPKDIDRIPPRRPPLYGGFDPSQWSSDPSGTPYSTQPVRPNSGIPVSHNLHPYQASESLYSRDRQDASELPATANKFRMKGRPRGESDLGRPVTYPQPQNGHAAVPMVQSGQHLPSVAEIRNSIYQYKWQEDVFSALLIPLPFIISSFLVPPVAILRKPVLVADKLPIAVGESDPTLSALQACALASGTLLLVGMFGRFRPADRRSSLKLARDLPVQNLNLLSMGTIKLVVTRLASVLFPFIAVAALGGTRTGLIILAAVTVGIVCPEEPPSQRPGAKSWKRTLLDRKWTSSVFLLSFFADLLLKQPEVEYSTIIRGYAVLTKAALFIQPQLPTLFPGLSRLSIFKQSSKFSPASESSSITPRSTPISALIATPLDTNFTLAAGGLLCGLTILFSMLSGLEISSDVVPVMLFTATIISAASLLLLSRPLSLRSSRKVGFTAATLLIVSLGWFHDFRTWPSALALGLFSFFTIVATALDTSGKSYDPRHEKLRTDSPHQHQHQHHHHDHVHSKASQFTQVLLQYTEGWPLIHSVLVSEDSRSIFYFLCINFAFMLVQLFYSIVSESLGLLSDSIHMFFDCFGMLVGLFAAVMTKWPASDRFPYGFGKVNTLSGFANGVFLVFVSIEFIWDSFERFLDGVQLKRVEELFVVSVLGLIVNLIGLKLTHGHHGHGHDHSHGHTHIHEPSHEHSHHHQDAHDITMSQPKQSSNSSHHHDDENMLGIYLHILADTMGSVAVIFSTALTYFTGYSFWDPLASCTIAVLIIAASYPLVRDSAKKLLLTVPDNIEWKVREALQELSGLRGVVGYGGPRFWVDDSEATVAGLELGNGHKHEHEHEHCADEKSKKQDGHQEKYARILGVIHVIASKDSDLEDVRMRTCLFLQERNMDIVVHVEREGAGRCWCGGDKSGGGIGVK